MLIKKGGHYREVAEKDFAKFKAKGYEQVATEKAEEKEELQGEAEKIVLEKDVFVSDGLKDNKRVPRKRG